MNQPHELFRYPVTGHPARDPAARLWLVQEFTAEQMKQALHTPDLQPVVRAAINKRLARIER